MTTDLNGTFGVHYVVNGQDTVDILRMITKDPLPENFGEEYKDVEIMRRHQAIKALWQLEQLQYHKLDITLQAPEAYADAMALEGDAYAAVEWAYSAGLIVGREEGRLGVNEPLTREQLAVMLYRYHLLQEGNTDAQTVEDAQSV